MTIEEIVSGLKTIVEPGRQKPDWICDEIRDACMDAIKFLENPVPCWTPLYERMPEDCDEVIVTIDEGQGKPYLRFAQFMECEDGAGERYWEFEDEGEVCKFNDVTAWMLLPRPYRELAWTIESMSRLRRYGSFLQLYRGRTGPMEETIRNLNLAVEFSLLDPLTGEPCGPEDIVGLRRTIHDACSGAIELLERGDLRWIPTSERQPDGTAEVIVTIDEGDGDPYIACMRFVTDDVTGEKRRVFDDGNDYSPEQVSAWMPMPEPYREVCRTNITVRETIPEMPGGSLYKIDVDGIEDEIRQILWGAAGSVFVGDNGDRIYYDKRVFMKLTGMLDRRIGRVPLALSHSCEGCTDNEPSQPAKGPCRACSRYYGDQYRKENAEQEETERSGLIVS